MGFFAAAFNFLLVLDFFFVILRWKISIFTFLECFGICLRSRQVHEMYISLRQFLHNESWRITTAFLWINFHQVSPSSTQHYSKGCKKTSFGIDRKKTTFIIRDTSLIHPNDTVVSHRTVMMALLMLHKRNRKKTSEAQSMQLKCYFMQIFEEAREMYFPLSPSL